MEVHNTKILLVVTMEMINGIKGNNQPMSLGEQHNQYNIIRAI